VKRGVCHARPSARVEWSAVLILAFLAGRPSVAADLKADEQVVFYPTLGWRATNGWELELHGCVFELERRAVLVPLVRRALGIDEAELKADEQAIFRTRARLFMVDHEGGRTLNVRLAAQKALPPVALGPSEAGGHMTRRIWVGDDALGGATVSNRCVRFEGLTNGNGAGGAPGEIHLVADTGLSVISDIDDTIKISQVLDQHALVRNTFCRPFKPVPGMADVYQRWARNRGAQFHYVSASPWQLYPPLADFIRSNAFPAGTFHLKHARLRDGTFVELFTSPERYKPGVIEPLLERFPGRRFVLVGDSGERDPEIYAAVARKHRKQVARIFIRDVTDEAADSRRYRETFADLPPDLWRIFKEPSAIAEAIP
jgi:hypothetical protein